MSTCISHTTRILPGLPDECYVFIPGRKVMESLAVARQGEAGFTVIPVPTPCENFEQVRQLAHAMNALGEITPLQEHCMRLGATYGWNTPGTDPSYYTPEEAARLQ